ncbi:MAG: HD domain-containing protein, partial [Candidatus Korarchaeota archaeon]|nr:HD domain-containing protein [Candidatus Korarchaeota archaeon]
RGVDGEGHAEASARAAERILRALGYPEGRIARVVEAIRSHGLSSSRAPRSVEAAILSDADKLDAIGAVGVARAFMESGRRGRGFEETLRHFEEKLLRLRDMMYTGEGRRLAEARHKAMEEFLEELLREQL